MATIKPNITFDKLDKKCIEELPLMVDVISSTFNKIKSLYDPFYEDLNEVIKRELKKKKNWHISPRSRGMNFYPFTSEEITNQTKIVSLENYFSLWGDFNIYSGRYAWHLRKGSFGIYLTFEYDITDENIPYSYFQIENWNIKKFGTLHSTNFYSSLCKSLPHNIKGEFTHPDLDIDNEAIWLSVKSFDVEQIISTFNTFRDKILIPYIHHLK